MRRRRSLRTQFLLKRPASAGLFYSAQGSHPPEGVVRPICMIGHSRCSSKAGFSSDTYTVTPDTALLKPYRLRTVKIAVQSTGLAVAVLALYPLLPGHGLINNGYYVALIVVATLGAAAFNFLPWEKILDLPRGMWVFYAWSFLDILLITLLVMVSRGGLSELFLLYVLTTIFLAVSYPPWGQAALLAVTFVMYAVASELGPESLSIASLFFRLATLGITALMGKFLSSELMAQMAAHSEAKDESQRRATLLAAVARAAKSMNSLDPDEVLNAVVSSALELGFDAGSICIFDEDTDTYTVVHSRGVPDEYAHGVHSMKSGMVSMVREEKKTVVENNYKELELALPVMRNAGFQAVIASPIWSRTKMVALLVAGSKTARTIEVEDQESFELLAAQASSAFENAKRFEHERQAVQRLEELDKLKQDFIATMSHELRTPLTIIKGMAQTLERRWDSLDAELRNEFLHKVNKNAEDLEVTINELTDFSKLQSGELRAEMQQIPVPSLVSAVLTKLEGKVVGKKISSSAQRGICVKGDLRLLEKALEHLVSNAAKHTPPGASINVTATRDRDTAVFEVVDDGNGIEEADIPALTKEFFRGGEVDTRTTRGTGMGLAMVNAILRLHSSRLEVSNVEPHGARFRFTLPMSSYADPSADQEPVQLEKIS